MQCSWLTRDSEPHGNVSTVQQISKTSMTISGEWVVFRFTQAAEASQGASISQGASTQQQMHSVAAERQCRAHIASRPSIDFSFQFSGWFPAPGVDVAIKSGLIHQLPLLKDVQSSTQVGESVLVPSNLPCSVWGLVSLLILLGGGVGVEEWFGGDPSLQDPSLPANTLLAASFMGCTDTVKQLTAWFQNCVRALAESYTPFASSSSHRLKVLRCVPSEHENAVFAGILAEVRTAVNLPALLLSKWIASSGNTIDLRSSEIWLLTPGKWVTLVAAICLAPPGAVQALHVNMSRGTWATSNDEVAMSALQSIVAHTTNLQTLCLYNVFCVVEQLPALHRLFSECSGSLTKLLLDTTWSRPPVMHEITSFFAAVAQVHGLRELHILNWYSFMSNEAYHEACDPLRRIPGLRIFVPKSDLKSPLMPTDRFPSGLNFFHLV